MRRRDSWALIGALLFGARTGVAWQTDQEAWKQFIDWYRSYTGPPFPPDVMKAYSELLASQGMPAEEVKNRLALLQKMAATSPRDVMTVHFNNVYRSQNPVFTKEPNALLARTVRGLKPGRALDVAMGQGRNAVFLAKLGWDVTGYDISDTGLAVARANAEQAAAKINAVLATHEDFDFGHSRWDLIVMTYAFTNMSDQKFIQRLCDSLAPGGIILVEQLNSGSMQPGPPNALFGTFQHFRVLHYEDTVDTADWSMKPARIGRIVAQKQ